MQPLLPSFDRGPWPSSSLPASWHFCADSESSDARAPFWQNLRRENDLEFPDSHQCLCGHQIVSTQTQSGAMASFTVTLEDFCRPSTMTEKESEFCDVWNRELGNEQSAQGRHT